jgi:hypothetical protein
MKRMRMVGAGVVIMAALALAVMAPADASASGPVWAYCAKALPKNTGVYTDKTCTTEAATHDGKYELLDGIGKGKGFKGKSSSEARFSWNVPGKGEFDLECNQTKVSGRPVAPNKVADVVIAFSKCRTNISEFEKSCVAQTLPLSGELGWIDREAGTAGVSLSSEASPGGIITEVQGCEPEVKERWSGSVIAEWSPVATVSKESTLSFLSDGFFTEETGFIYANVPAAFEGEETEHFLVNELNAPATGFEWTTDGVRSGGLNATVPLKGETLMIH